MKRRGFFGLLAAAAAAPVVAKAAEPKGLRNVITGDPHPGPGYEPRGLVSPAAMEMQRDREAGIRCIVCRVPWDGHTLSIDHVCEYCHFGRPRR